MAIREKIRRKIRAHKASARPVRRAATHHRKPVLIDLKKTRGHDAPAKAGPIISYSKSLRFLATLSDYERLRIVRYNHDNFNLDRMRALLKKLGNPHEHFRSVHVAGTKGKGSTCTMIAAMLQANGYKVGLYTSPHLVDVRERIAIDGDMIPQASFARLVRLVEPMVARLKPTPTYFDVLTAIAFKYFADNKVDIAVVETGLGGRLDSTNVIRPEVTAITSISHDHMAQLGPTLGHIATEKAGIFKHNIPALSVIQDPQAEAALRKVAEKVGAPLEFTGQTIEFSYRFESSRMLGPHNRVCLTTPNSKFEHLAVPLIGEHQAINCGLALAVIDRLKSRGIAINDSRAMEGLSKVTIPGRMEMVAQTPRVIVDGAHNAASLDAAMKAIGQHIPYDSMVVIFGCCADKDVPGMLERITSGADKVIFTRVNSVRSADPHELAAQYVELYGKMAQVAENLEEALGIANRAVTKEDLICITGSFYLVGEAKKLFAAKAAAEARNHKAE
ncbi:MAG TPA: folylpolyglutamate synthase/dihydrofolate synthase family protein [Tepidisphaeraceae bacterium]|jgi:dihydrofolate synthase/folylpolyglutamate synthase|nr:folylpolyglutamate synthase/dihydrofolate synthase family protein [Tepidisphaeraceae bacterium]